MRNLLLSFLLVFCIFSGRAHAQMTDVLVDTSGSTKGDEGRQIRSALAELGKEYVSVTPWNYTPETTLFGIANEVASRLPRTDHSTYLGSALRHYDDDHVVCRKIIVLVHGEANDMDVVEDLVPKLVQRNFVAVLVVGDKDAWLQTYSSLVENDNYLVMKLEPGILPRLYYDETRLRECLLELS